MSALSKIAVLTFAGLPQMRAGRHGGKDILLQKQTNRQVQREHENGTGLSYLNPDPFPGLIQATHEQKKKQGKKKRGNSRTKKETRKERNKQTKKEKERKKQTKKKKRKEKKR